MSHFTVGVITKNGENYEVDNLLEPFSEHIEVERFISKAELIARGREHTERLKLTQKAGWTDEQFYQEELEWVEEEDIMADGSVRSTYNPDSKWDWYVIGGRWENSLRTKNNRMVNTCRVAELNLQPDPKQVAEATRFWEIVVEEQETRPEEEKLGIYKTFYKKEYYLEQYGTKEEYVEQATEVGTYAILTPDGEWHEPGEMGWFGIDSSSRESRKLYRDKSAAIFDKYKDHYLTVVDCHI